MNAPGDSIVAFLDRAITEAESWGLLLRTTADRKLVALHRSIACESFGCDCGSCCATCRWTNADESGDPARWGETEQCVYPCPTIVALAEGYGWTEGER